QPRRVPGLLAAQAWAAGEESAARARHGALRAASSYSRRPRRRHASRARCARALRWRGRAVVGKRGDVARRPSQSRVARGRSRAAGGREEVRRSRSLAAVAEPRARDPFERQGAIVIVRALFALCAALVLGGPASAQPYPNKPIRIV